jgi:transposase-like protein
MRVDGPVEKVNVLVLIGVSADGVKQVLALQARDKESSTNWRQLFRDLKTRGLDSSKVQLGMMGYRDLRKSSNRSLKEQLFSAARYISLVT